MTNQKAFAKAQKYIPGGVDSPVRAFGSVGGEPVIIERGNHDQLLEQKGIYYRMVQEQYRDFDQFARKAGEA